MSRMRTLLTVGTCAFLSLAITYQARSDDPKKKQSSENSAQGAKRGQIAVGARIPDFTVTLDGKSLKLSEIRKDKSITKDGTLVLTFWCSFCHSCRHVDSSLDKLARKYHGKVGVVAIDSSAGETAEEINAFKKKKGMTLPIAINSNGSAAKMLGVRSTTTTLIVDKDGIVRYFGQFKDRRHEFAEDALESLLAGKKIRVKKTRQKG